MMELWIQTAILWLHLLSMATVFGGILFIKIALTPSLGAAPLPPAAAKPVHGGAGLLLLTGLVLAYFKFAGPAAVYTERAPLLVAIKLLLLIALGACAGIGAKKAKAANHAGAAGPWSAALAIIAVAVFLGLLV